MPFALSSVRLSFISFSLLWFTFVCPLSSFRHSHSPLKSFFFFFSCLFQSHVRLHLLLPFHFRLLSFFHLRLSHLICVLFFSSPLSIFCFFFSLFLFPLVDVRSCLEAHSTSGTHVSYIQICFSLPFAIHCSSFLYPSLFYSPIPVHSTSDIPSHSSRLQFYTISHFLSCSIFLPSLLSSIFFFYLSSRP